LIGYKEIIGDIQYLEILKNVALIVPYKTRKRQR